jgi:hypothetical protein
MTAREKIQQAIQKCKTASKNNERGLGTYFEGKANALQWVLSELNKEQSKWISVEKMPDYDGEYLCYIHNEQECGNTWKYQKIIINRFNAWVLSSGEVVTHWQPLSEPPKQ